MSSDANFFLRKTLGDDFLESLVKFELWKPGTKTTVDHEEIKTALMIVPRTLMSFLIYHLSSMEIGETKETQLPVSEVGAMMRVTKHERDVYSGEIEQDNKRIVDFKYRSIPGIGLVIMSAFELYDTSKLLEPPQEPQAPKMGAGDVQKMIDERLILHDLIGKVVDSKMSERDAIQQLILAKLTEVAKVSEKQKQISDLRVLNEVTTPQDDPYFRGMTNGLEVANAVVNDQEPKFVEAPKKKGSPLKDFLSKREGKLKKNEYPVQLAKGEHVHCPDCGKDIFNGEIFSGCICFGDDMDKKVYIKKSEDGVKVRFGRGWDPENIEMLLEVLRRDNGK